MNCNARKTNKQHTFVPWMSAERRKSKWVVEIIILHFWKYQLRIGENP
jgi:hypothetical protein